MAKPYLDLLTYNEARTYREIIKCRGYVIPFWLKSGAPDFPGHVTFVDSVGDVTRHGAVPTIPFAAFRPCMRDYFSSGVSAGEEIRAYDVYWYCLDPQKGLYLLEEPVENHFRRFGKTSSFAKSDVKAWLDGWNRIFFNRPNVDRGKMCGGCANWHCGCDYDMELEGFCNGADALEYSTAEVCPLVYSAEQEWYENHDPDVPYCP